VILPLRNQITHQTQLQYNAMQVGAFRLLQARNDEIDAGVAYVEALAQYWLARSRVQQILAGSLPQLATESRAPAQEPVGRTRSGGH
jgi:outer membrane protein TolC